MSNLDIYHVQYREWPKKIKYLRSTYLFYYHFIIFLNYNFILKKSKINLYEDKKSYFKRKKINLKS